MNLSETETDDLIRFLANAYKTRLCCGGHGKAAGNQKREDDIKRELRARNAEIPSRETLRVFGVFNGPGAY
jgi:hypothetical protein